MPFLSLQQITAVIRVKENKSSFYIFIHIHKMSTFFADEQLLKEKTKITAQLPSSPRLNLMLKQKIFPFI